ncbi:MAG: TIGR03936 family radical SAM-associated protein, partial [Actinomycetota bacterium]|nr:TIGR03936 family radical SAM-associated protein [Actinomycetota bacterium]
MTAVPAVTRVRLRFVKTGKIRWTSHRDVARMWERAVRRVGLPVAYSLGFSPRPKLHFGLALSTAHESLGEYLDVDLDPAAGAVIDVAGLPQLLTPCLPAGVDLQAAAVIDTADDSLQQAVTSCSWRVEVAGGGVPGLARSVQG